MKQNIDSVDQAMDTMLDRSAIPTLRLALATIYIWFGALKLFGVSPIADLVARSMPIVPKEVSVPLVGAMEVAIGLGLLFKVALRRTLGLFVFQMAGTFLPLLMSPREIFRQGNPFLLTERGEFILKNVVLLAAGMAVGSTVRENEDTEQTIEHT